jgi:hypothetical protein
MKVLAIVVSHLITTKIKNKKERFANEINWYC